MHILILLFSLMGAGAFWWYRLKYMGEAANEAVDAVGRLRGNMRRKTLRKKAEMSPITAIRDPVTAAATVILAIAAEDILVSEELEQRLRDAISSIAESAKKANEAVIYAKWAVNQIDDAPFTIDRLGNFLKPLLDEREKRQLIEMLRATAVPEERHPQFKLRMEALQRKLGLEVEKRWYLPA